jgi:hypothetical protein
MKNDKLTSTSFIFSFSLFISFTLVTSNNPNHDAVPTYKHR